MSTHSETLPITDDLKIHNLDIPDIPKDIIFPDEVNRYLRDRIRYLTHENGMLQKNLEEKASRLSETETQLKSIDLQLRKMQNSSSFVSSMDVANSKIVELSKKLRDRTSEMESYKTKNAKLQKRLLEMQHDQKTIDSTSEQEEKETPSVSERESTIKLLQDKLSSVSCKLFDTKNLNTQLKNDLKVANKMLQQEVGETFESLQTVNNWRGRAQIICDLQEKNSELREKLKMYQDKDCRPKEWMSTSSRHDKKIDSLTQENQNLHQELHETKKKFESARGRCKYLDTELIVTKTKLKAAFEQSERENDRFTTLAAQMSQHQNKENEHIKNLQKQLQKTESVVKSLKVELSKEKCINENFQKELNKKNANIDELKHDLEKNRPSSSLKNRMINEKELGRLEAERLRLLELAELSNKRLEEVRNLHTDLQMQYQQERHKAAKLETKLARLELDLNLDKSTTYSGHSLKANSKTKDETLLNKLELAEENLKVLKARLDIEKQERDADFNEFKSILLDYKGDLGNK